MTANRSLENDPRAILVDLYLEPAPDYRHDLVQQFAATRQRPAWTFAERWLPMGVNTLVQQTFRPMPRRTVALAGALALLLAIAFAIYVGSQRPVPMPFGPARNGGLAVAEGGDLFLIDQETGLRTLAIDGPGEITLPTYSRDGTQLAFLRELDGVTGLVITDDLGRNPRGLSTSEIGDLANLESYDWSPDGRSILIATAVDGRASPVIVPTDGSPARALTVGFAVQSPIWLPPSGAEILFRGITGTGHGLFAMRTDGSEPRPVVAPNGGAEYDALFYAASPDGSQVAYQWRDDADLQLLYVVPTAGGTPRALSSIESVAAAWSPDGQWLAFFSGSGVYVVRADGSAPQVELLPLDTPSFLPVRWAPDGQHLLFVDGRGWTVLLDPSTGSRTTPPWTTTGLPDWQRLAPAH